MCPINCIWITNLITDILMCNWRKCSIFNIPKVMFKMHSKALWILNNVFFEEKNINVQQWVKYLLFNSQLWNLFYIVAYINVFLPLMFWDHIQKTIISFVMRLTCHLLIEYRNWTLPPFYWFWSEVQCW